MVDILPDFILACGLMELGYQCHPQVRGSLETYLNELKQWNKAYNLTSITDDKEIITKHFLDSLLYLKVIEKTCPSLSVVNICDVGSGAGFPGLPIAIVRPQFKLVLVETSHKKCAFLRHMIHTLQLNNTDVINKNVQEISDIKFDVIVTRALFTAKDMIKRCRHLMNDHSIMLLSKGQKVDEEIKQIPSNIKFTTQKYMLPFTNIERIIIIIYAS